MCSWLRRVPAWRARLRRFSLDFSLALLCGAALADHDEDEIPAGYGDHDWAGHALKHGEVRPLAKSLALVEAWEPGEVTEIELERWRRRGERRWAYEVGLN